MSVSPNTSAAALSPQQIAGSPPQAPSPMSVDAHPDVDPVALFTEAAGLPDPFVDDIHTWCNAQYAPDDNTYVDPIIIDCPGLGGGVLGLGTMPDLTFRTPKVGKGHQLYGPTLAPVDKYESTQPQHLTTCRGHSVATHHFTQLLWDIPSTATLWEEVTGMKAGLIVHRTSLVLLTAAHLPVHRLALHAQFVVGSFFSSSSVYIPRLPGYGCPC